MLKTRIIPTLLWKDSGLVKGVGFDSWRRIGTVLPAIKVYNTREVDELMLLDISASGENRDPDYDSIAEFSSECFVPLTVGGGIRNLEQIRTLLRSGADKICINSYAYENPHIIRQASDAFGSQCIVASIDAKLNAQGKYECMSHCGTQPTGKEPSAWAKELQQLGAGEILITSIERDGTLQGYDLDLIASISRATTIHTIASGGAGSYQHMLEAIQQGHASAIAAASMFHFTQQTPREAKQFLATQGIPVRNTHAS